MSLEAHGWRWAEPTPNGRRIVAGWFTDDGRALIANTLGVMLFDGQRLVAPDGGVVDHQIADIWGDGPSNAWLVGSGGLVLRWNGQALVPVSSGASGTAFFTAVAGLRTGEVFFGTAQAGRRWTGAQFVALPALPGGYRTQDLHSPDGVTMFALGTSFVSAVRWGLFRWNGTTWDAVHVGSLGNARSLHGQTPEALWLVAGNAVHRANGLVTTALNDDGGVADGGADAGLFRVPTGGFSGNPNMVFTTRTDAGQARVFVAGDGLLEVLPDAGWDRTLVYGTQQHDVTWVGGPTSGPPFFALGASLIRKDEPGFTVVASPYRVPTMSMFVFQPAAAGPFHAVSDDVVWWFPPSAFSMMTPTELNVVDGGMTALVSGPPITATHCYAPRECIVGNLFGQLGYFTGATHTFHGNLSGIVTKLAPSRVGSVYAVTESGGLGVWRDGGVTPLPLPPGIPAQLRSIADITVRGDDELWVAAEDAALNAGGVFRLTATGWEATGPLPDAGWPFVPTTVLAVNDSLVLAGGANQVGTWDGGSWNLQPFPAGRSLGFFELVDGRVFSRSNGQLQRLSDAGVFEPFGPERVPLPRLSSSPSWLWMGFSTEAGVLRRPR